MYALQGTIADQPTRDSNLFCEKQLPPHLLLYTTEYMDIITIYVDSIKCMTFSTIVDNAERS
jgi:hypothetical protein